MLQLVGAALTVLSTSWAGILISQRLITKVKFIEHMLSFITTISTQIRYSGDALFQILERENSVVLSPLVSECMRQICKGNSFQKSWNMGVQNLPGSYGLKEEETALLTEFGKGLGVTDIDGQLAHCELYRERFSVRLKELKEEKETKVKLYRSLGVFLGMALALFIL